MGAQVILHADDFGLNRAVTDGIIAGFRRGLLTSTALLANAPDAARAIAAWKQLSEERANDKLPSGELRKELGDTCDPFDLGVHLNLTQGRPLTADGFPSELLDAQGRFPGIVRLFARLQRLSGHFQTELRAELSAQIKLLLDHGLRPTHLNGHQYVEMIPQVARLLPELLERFRIAAVRVPLEPGLLRTVLWHEQRPAAYLLALIKHRFARRFRSTVASHSRSYTDRYFGTAHAGRIDGPLLQRFLKRAGNHGVSEIAFHPAIAGPVSAESHADGWHDPLAVGRVAERQLLESPELLAMLKTRSARLGRLSQLRAA